MDKKLLVIGVGMAAEAFAAMPNFKSSPYDHKDFHFLIQSASSVCQYTIYRETKRHFYYTQQQHQEPQWQVLPHIAEKGFDKVALISHNTFVYWPDILFWVMNILREENRKPSTILIRPYYQGCENVADIRNSLLKRFPPFIELSRAKGPDLYADLPEMNDAPSDLIYPFHSLPYTYVTIHEHAQPLPIKVKIHLDKEGDSFINMIYDSGKEKGMPVQRFASVSRVGSF